jgi:hypothetical protein
LRRKYVEFLKGEMGIKVVEDWYKITFDMMKKVAKKVPPEYSLYKVFLMVSITKNFPLNFPKGQRI